MGTMSNDKLKTPEDLRHSTGVMTEENAGHRTILKELFNHMAESSEKDKALINANFTDNPRREPHSAMLHKDAEDLRVILTLKEKVHGILE